MSAKTIVGLTKTIKDPETQSDVSHHVVTGYQVNLVSQKSMASLASYVAAGAKRPVSFVTLQRDGVPVGDPVQWLYAGMLAADGPDHVLAGATPVFEAGSATPAA